MAPIWSAKVGLACAMSQKDSKRVPILEIRHYDDPRASGHLSRCLCEFASFGLVATKQRFGSMSNSSQVAACLYSDQLTVRTGVHSAMPSLRSVASLMCWLTLMMLAISQVDAVAAPQVRAEPVPTPSTTSNNVSASGPSNVTSAAPSSRPTGNSTSNGNSTVSGDRNNTAAGNRTSTSTTPTTLPFATDFQTQVSDINSV